MPKYKKGKKQSQQIEDKRKKLNDLKNDMFNSSIKALVFSGTFLILSLLFNGNIILIETESGTALDIVMKAVKVIIIVLFFTFTLLALANTMELKGKPVEIKEILFIVIISIIQGIRSMTIVWISLALIFIVLCYLWIVQVKVEN